MGKLSGEQGRNAFMFCVKRDSVTRCAQEDGSCKGDIVLDHKDNNPSNNPKDGSNWQQLCRSHNRRKNPGEKRVAANKFAGTMKIQHSLELERVRERKGVRGISGELEKSERIKPIIKQYLIKTIAERGGSMLLSDAEREAAGDDVGNCDKKTIAKYLDVWTARNGAFEIKPIEGVDCLVMRKGE